MRPFKDLTDLTHKIPLIARLLTKESASAKKILWSAVELLEKKSDWNASLPLQDIIENIGFETKNHWGPAIRVFNSKLVGSLFVASPLSSDQYHLSSAIIIAIQTSLGIIPPLVQAQAPITTPRKRRPVRRPSDSAHTRTMQRADRENKARMRKMRNMSKLKPSFFKMTSSLAYTRNPWLEIQKRYKLDQPLARRRPSIFFSAQLDEIFESAHTIESGFMNGRY